MGKSWIENSLILAFLLFITGAILNFILGLGLSLFGVKGSFINDLGFLLIAYMLGFFYTRKTNQVMPKGLRLKIISLFFLIYIIITFLITYFITSAGFIVVFFLVAFASFFIIIECLVIYWIFGFVGKTYLKNMNKSIN